VVFLPLPFQPNCARELGIDAFDGVLW